MRSAASFDGQSSYAIVNQGLIAEQANWTWSAWLYSPQGATENPQIQSIYTEGYQAGSVFRLDILTNVTMQVGAWNIAFSGQWAEWMWVDVPYVLTNGWNHLAIALAEGGVGSGALSVFFNGVLTNSAVLQSVVPGGASWGVIGNGWGPAFTYLAVPWKGSMADLRFYNRALSPNEVAELYAIESMPPSPPPCVPHDATATATVVDGFVVAAAITDGGCGYTNTPAARIIGGWRQRGRGRCRGQQRGRDCRQHSGRG
jgi:hypothetical protein